jgi:hypothetical protein
MTGKSEEFRGRPVQVPYIPPKKSQDLTLGSNPELLGEKPAI